MPSFAWSSRFREGQWRAFRSFMLQERRDASDRFMVIQAERNRIGTVRILWATDDEGKPTEQRVGISCTPPGSSLCKLLRAYCALGGNPFDISAFTRPDSGVEVTGVRQTQPSEGILHPQDIRYAYDAGVSDGDGSLAKYRSSRLGGRRYTEKEREVAAIAWRGRKWINQEIWFKRTRLEELIIKLVDLREQLDQEVEDLLWATYGDMMGSPGYEADRFTDSLSAGNIAYFFDSTFRIPDPTEPGRVPYDPTASAGEPGAPNEDVLGGFPSLMSDLPEEDNTAL
jgi:hypothetical protein